MIETARVLGDRVPGAVEGYFASADEGQAHRAALAFSEDAIYAVPIPGAIETDARLETYGRVKLAARLAARGVPASKHSPLLCVTDGESCLIEGVIINSAKNLAERSFVASIQLDSAGLITRYLAYATSIVVEPGPAEAAPVAPPTKDSSAAQMIEKYFDALDRGKFEEAAACFSEDVLYSHPPYRNTGTVDGDHRVEFRGQKELLAAFQARGVQPTTHSILVSLQRGPHCLFEGSVARTGSPGGSFVSSVTLDDRGLIRRYVAYLCLPQVERV